VTLSNLPLNTPHCLQCL